MEKVIIGTRGSELALTQAYYVRDLIENLGFVVEIKVITTKGDRDMRDFNKMNNSLNKELFVKEIEQQMIDGKIDIAVHSMKDMPSKTPDQLINYCFPVREDNRDVLVSNGDISFDKLPPFSVIGTGSKRREKELKNMREDIIVKPIRGNINTRLKQLEEGKYDAIVLAFAGLKRINLQKKITQIFSHNEIMPAPAQGILCVQCRKNDNKIYNILDKISNENVKMVCEAERMFSNAFNGGCTTPIGCNAFIDGDIITITGSYYDGKNKIVETSTGNYKNGGHLEIANDLVFKINKQIKKINENRVILEKKEQFKKQDKRKVYIAGAGCGDEQLITVKLLNVIKKADCIIYDRLVNKNILNESKKGAELIYMGKENTEGGELQLKINDTIVKKAKEYNTVLRLKGGDPFVFGRGGEEILALIDENIDFEVIPGISSSIAAPEYAGIPITHRGINTSFHVFTGQTRVDGNQLDYKTIAKLDGTLIFLMGIGNIKKIVEGLISNGKNKNTPVAIVKNGTTTKQEVYNGELHNICDIVEKNNIKSPAVIVIGEVTELREKMSWFEKKPLFGKNILITRNIEKQKNITNRINELGGQAISLPLIEIEHVNFDKTIVEKAKVLLFNSENSVESFMRGIDDIRCLNDKKIGVIGEKTEKSLKKYKLTADFYPYKYLASELAKESIKFSSENDIILFITSDISPVDVEKYSLEYERNFKKIVTYKTKTKIHSKDMTRESVKESDILVFLSSSTFESFITNIFGDDENKEKDIAFIQRELINILKNKIVASIGPVTSKTIRKYGVCVDIEAKVFNEDGVIDEILKKLEREE